MSVIVTLSRILLTITTVVLSVLTAISTSPTTEVLLVPVILASLPLGSLLVQGNDVGDKTQQPSGDPQFEMVSNPKAAGNVGMPFNAQLGNAKYEPVSSKQAGREDKLSANILIDRELHEIDSMR